MKRGLIDQVEFAVRAGNGGVGAISFRREKYTLKGGPDGGDGGNGGSVTFVANPHMTTLMDYAGKILFEAPSGGRGLKKKMHGKDAKSITLEIPVGTEIWQKIAVDVMPVVVVDPFDKDEVRAALKTNRYRAMKQIAKGNYRLEKIADLSEPGMKFLVAAGGKGGKGNDHFKSSVNTTPKYAEPGGYGEERFLKLEMKILADVGLVGLPNAGKSTLLSVLSAARPEIADYPFTTITPNLGVLEIANSSPFFDSAGPRSAADATQKIPTASAKRQIIIADIPGIIEDAHEGKGLGVEFLKHIERCVTLLYVISPTDQDLEKISNDQFSISNDLIEQFRVVRNEVLSYGHGVDAKKRIVVINKSDVLSDSQISEIVTSFETLGEQVVVTSAATRKGIDELKTVISQLC